MIETAQCPTREELIRLNHGDLPGEQLESVCDHVEVCKKCQLILGQLDEPPNELGKQLAQITPDDLENARVAIEAETLKEMATSVWDRFSPTLESKDRKPTLTVPCNLRQYEALRLIGHGGMGEVYEGRHTNLKRPVALKVIHGIRQDDPVAYEHFLREMETAGQLEHPNLVRAYDAWEHDGCLFLAQELLEGESLQQLGTSGQITTPSEIVDAMLGTCRALQQLHVKKFVHRDVKPGNIMRLTDGTIKLIDYGLAIAVEAGKPAARMGAGTIGYMSPEQAHGTSPIDHRSDIYSAGRVLKYLLSKLPADAQAALASGLADKLYELADRLTQKKPEDRPQNAYSVIVQLEQIQQSLRASSLTQSPPDSAASVAEVPKSSAAAKPKAASSTAVEAGGSAPMSRRVIGWTAMIAILLGLLGFGAYQIIFKTDQQATVVVENHEPGDVIKITSEDGKVRSVELGDPAKFVVDPGTYELNLRDANDRELDPTGITVTGPDQLTVRIVNRASAVRRDPNEGIEPAGQLSKLEMLELGNADRPKLLSAPFGSEDIASAREAWSEYLGLPQSITVGVPQNPEFKLEFILIPPGTFEMGMPKDLALIPGNKEEWAATSKPAHTVTITRPFYLSRHEVTQAQFRDVTGTELTPVTDDGTELPATQIGWQACVDFCDRVTGSESNLPDGAKLRLPTEAEWEYACRAGTLSRFWNGDSIGPEEASLRFDDREMKLEPVDAFEANPFGLYNVHGNIAEWCSDWFDPEFYTSSPADDPTGPDSGSRKVIRGGGVSNPPFAATSYWRMSYEPETRSSSIGLRPVIELPTR